ncbi:MAG: CoA-binding protein [Candidatus Bathyarchaeota archaeon]|nr:CoA-binding protein [Candidatus Bathyarchaeota archaeon]
MSQNQIKESLTKYQTIAVVGLSDNPARDSYRVSGYMQNCGYKIIPINPFVVEVLGEKSYRSLLEVPAEIQKTIQIVDIFRKAQDVLPIVEQVALLKERLGVPFVVWMQMGIVNEQAAEVAEKSGLVVVMDRCLMVEHRKMVKLRRAVAKQPLRL